MKIFYIINLFFLIGFTHILHSQDMKNNKYSANVIFASENNKTSKENLIDCINYYKQNFNGRTPLCSFYNNKNSGTNCKDLPSLIDTLIDDCRFVECIIMPKSYRVTGKKVRKIVTYKLLFEDSNKKLFQIFSPNHKNDLI